MTDVLVTYGGFAADHPECGGVLREAGLQLSLRPRDDDRTAAQLSSLLQGSIAAIADADPFTASVFEANPGLRVIARTGVGLDSIDLDAATAAGVVVTVTPGVNDETVADHALALILSALRRLGEQDTLVRGGGWRDFGIPLSQLHGKTVGIVGYGAIGRAAARRVSGFGATAIAYDPMLRDADIPLVSLDELLSRSDVVSVHAPLTDATANLIDAERIATMKPGAVLVNTARGPIVDQRALINALRDGRLAAAGLDVFEDEPPGIGPLSELPNVILSPHVGGISSDSNVAMSRLASQSVLDVIAGTAPRHVANPGVLSR